MRKFIDIVAEGQANISVDGYWITDTGDLIFSDWDNEVHHVHTANTYFGKSEDDEEDGFELAMNTGWIRVIIFPKMQLCADWRRPTPKALAKLYNVVRDADEFPNYFIDGMPEAGDDEIGISKTEFLRILYQQIQNSRLVIAESVEETMLYHATPVREWESIQREGVRPVSYWGSMEIAEYYAEDTESVIIGVPLSAFEESLLEPDHPGIAEPVTHSTIGKPESQVIAEWSACAGTWQDSLRIIESVRYRGVVPPSAFRSVE